jgi:hypothetical protein
MDLGLVLTVLWRSRRLVIAGVLFGAVLAVLAYGTPSFSGGSPTLKPRFAEVWKSESQLLIAQSDYPYRQAPEADEPSRPLGSLSPIYANLANGEVVRSEIRRRLGTGGTVKASEDIDLAASSFLPFVNFTATAPTGAEASRFALGAASIFQGFVARQQAASGIPENRRIRLAIVETGAEAKLVEGHKPSIPILVFVAVLIATVAIVLIRENIRPRAAADAARVDPPGRAPAPAPQLFTEPDLGEDLGHPRPANGRHDQAPALHRDPLMTGNVPR